MLTETQLREMFATQDALNRHIDVDWMHSDHDWGLAAAAECMELTDHLGWKWWKHTPDSSMAQVHLEVVDIWHFVMSGLIARGQTVRAQLLMLTLQDAATIGLFVAPRPMDGAKALIRTVLGPTGTNPRATLSAFVYLMLSVRLSFDELYRVYTAKAALNQFRQDNGYKSGGYIKDWLGEEDNVYLEKISTQNPTFTTAELVGALTARYAEVCRATR